ncbi:MAG TPA: T9SS type A sorting domain-containing protein [Puia sp.]|nr:T9SS type A sorting domain-containing protein [Puia sp.]
MKNFTLVTFLLVLFAQPLFSQAIFQSAGSGNWSSPTSWTLVSGSSSTNYPVAGDTATINSANNITVDVNSQCNQLTINGGSSLLLNSSTSILTVSNGLSLSGTSTISLNPGLLTISGTLSITQASTVTVTQGALTVVGATTLNSVGSASGTTTLLDVEGGAFSCAGITSITATTRVAELRIGGSAVTLAGGVVTTSANARINFTGSGALTLAGIITIPNASSFIPGTGRVVYFGIPGSNQTVAPLSYYRLVITGLGSGIKEINGAVTVTDTLTLLTDTLLVNSGGSLTLSNGITIVRTAGQLISAPTFAGTANIVYNDVAHDTTGLEIPSAAGVLQDLTVSDIAGIALGSNVTVNDNLNLQQGPLLTNNYTLAITNTAGGSGSDPAISRTNGYVIGTITRSIGTTTGLRIFPLGVGIGSGQNYREFDLDYTTAPSVAGIIAAQAIDSAAPAQSGLPLTDNTEVINKTAPMYWQADASGGLSGGAYTLSLTATGAPGVSDLTTLRIVKRPSAGGPWILDGTAGVNAGTTSAPVIVRTGMSGFSQFTFGSDNSNTLPITLLSFTGITAGNNVLLEWTTASENNNLLFTVEHSIDGHSFTAIGTLPGAGSTVEQHSYSFTHTNAPTGINYYRLKQTDADGKETYSNTITCSVLNTTAGLSVFPNPASGVITIQTVPNTVLKLFNAGGQFIRSLSVGTNDISALSKGMYYIKAQGSAVLLEKK